VFHVDGSEAKTSLEAIYIMASGFIIF